MVHRILVPLDGSVFAESALPYALALAARSGAAIDLVCVEEPSAAFAHNEWTTAVRAWSLDYLADVARRAAEAGGSVETTLLEGRVWEALVQRVERSQADLVIMATHGRGALSRAWLGSTADAFVRHATRPVLLVRPEAEPDETRPLEPMGFRHVLIALDGSDLSRSVLGPAVELGAAFGARLTLLRVVAFPTELWSPYVPQSVPLDIESIEQAKQGASEALEAVASESRGQGLAVEVEVAVDSRPAHAILERAETLGCDLIALGTHGRGGVARMILGSTTDKVVRSAHRPVLVVRPDEDDGVSRDAQ